MIDSKRGTIWYQPADNGPCPCGERVRIVMPDGSAEWMRLKGSPFGIGAYWGQPCWNMTYSGEPKAKSGREALRLMRVYDKKVGFAKATFVGYV